MVDVKPSSLKPRNRPANQAGGQFAARADVVVRVALAIPGAYASTAIWVRLLARVLPGGALSASLTATMLSFAICATVVVAVFAARSALRAVMWVGLLAALGIVGIYAIELLQTAA